MFAGARVTLKLHRFEIAVAALAAVAAGVLGISMALRIDALGVSQACLDSVWLSQDGSSASEECFALIRAGSEVLGESFLDGQGTVPLSIMGALPFLLGLLGGVPIVARELEARTAQTAWSLDGSRVRWLARQVLPVALLLGAAMSFAALAAGPVADDFVAWGHGGEASVIGLHGGLAVVRAFGAFGIGLAVGALLGRTLPAFLFGVALSLALLFALGNVRTAWMASLEPMVVQHPSPLTGEYIVDPRSVTTGWAVEAPDGILLSSEEARELATAAGVETPPPGDVQDTPALAWYEENGYVLLPIGITDEMALGWAPFDGLAFGLVGVIGLGSTVVLVNRRRPV
jgi:hypothetical protein